MADISFDQALDIGYGTLQDIRRKKPPLATYAYSNYQFYNTFFKGNVKTVGDVLEGHVTLDSEGNASHQGFWAQDALIKKNINQRYRLDWRLASGGMLWNEIEMSINQNPSRIYNVWEQQYDSAVKDIIEDVFLKIMTGRTSSADTDNPYSIFNWLSMGTTGSTGGFTGYSATYNDGSTPGAVFDKGGISSSSSSNADWASYFADHDGNIDDSLLEILDEAARKTNFQVPVTPLGKLEVEKVTYAMYTNNSIIKKLNTFYSKADDNMGYRPDSHYGTPSLNRMPLIYCPPLDANSGANLSVYGTDPIVGVNHNVLYPVILKGWDFKVTKRPDSNRHNVLSLFMDLVYQVWCNTSPKYAGFLVTNSTVTPS